MSTEFKANVHLAQLAKAFAPGGRARREAYENHIAPLLKLLQTQRTREERTTIDVGVTSTCPGEGVSTIAFHLARLAAEAGLGETLLVRASPRPNNFIDVAEGRGGPGFRQLLRGEAYLDDCVRRVGNSQLACLDLGGSGDQQGQLPLHRAARVMDNLRRNYGFIVVDLPCVTEPGPCLPLAGLLSGVILTVEAERLRGDQLENSCQLLRLSGATILGVVLNKHRSATPRRVAR